MKDSAINTTFGLFLIGIGATVTLMSVEPFMQLLAISLASVGGIFVGKGTLSSS